MPEIDEKIERAIREILDEKQREGVKVLDK